VSEEATIDVNVYINTKTLYAPHLLNIEGLSLIFYFKT